MTKRSRRLLLLFTVVGLAAFVMAGWLLWPRTAITLANGERIREGMTVEEIEAILGGPPRDDSTGPLAPDHSNLDYRGGTKLVWPPWPVSGRPPPLEWISDRVAVRVHVDDAGRAVAVSRVPLCRLDESVFDMLRRRLRL